MWVDGRGLQYRTLPCGVRTDACRLQYRGLALLYIGVSKMAARLGRLAVNDTAFFLCDMQEKFRPSIRYFPEIIKVAQRMVSSCALGFLKLFLLFCL